MEIQAILIPTLFVVSGLLAFSIGWSRLTSFVTIFANAAALSLICWIIAERQYGFWYVGDIFRMDALAAFGVLLITTIALIANSYGHVYISRELSENEITPTRARQYLGLVQFFVAAMICVATADNLGIMWMAVEATTVTTAFLVHHRRTHQSLEAAWKYVVVGSIGVAIAFLGTALIYFASVHSLGEGTLSWFELSSSSANLDPGVMKLAIALCLLGYGTKVGTAPMHTWLPDAHSQAPAPVSALMSGVVISVSFIAVMRVTSLVIDTTAYSDIRYMMGFLGVITMLVGVLLIAKQRDYKRLLAYSSIEHMGIALIGLSIGTPIAIAAVLFHLLGHALVKSALFCTSGEILASHNTTTIDDISGLTRSQPIVGTLFVVGLIGLIGFPPFALFFSEFAIISQSFEEKQYFAGVSLLLLLFGAFAVISFRMQNFLFGQPQHSAIAQPRFQVFAMIGVALFLAALLGLSSYPIATLLEDSSKVIQR